MRSWSKDRLQESNRIAEFVFKEVTMKSASIGFVLCMSKIPSDNQVIWMLYVSAINHSTIWQKKSCSTPEKAPFR